MGLKQVLDIVLTLMLMLLTGVAVWALLVLVRTLRSANVLFEDLDERLVPLLTKAGKTVDAVNIELERVDDLVDRVQRVSDRVSRGTHIAEHALQVPLERAAEFAERVRRFLVAHARGKGT